MDILVKYLIGFELGYGLYRFSDGNHAINVMQNNFTGDIYLPSLRQVHYQFHLLQQTPHPSYSVQDPSNPFQKIFTASTIYIFFGVPFNSYGLKW